LSIIKEDSLVRGEKKEKRLSVLFDSGSARSLIRSDVAEELTTPRDLPAPIGVTVADGHEVACKSYCNLVVEVEGKEVVIQLLLVDDLPVPLIFGASEMEAYMIKLDLARKRLDLFEFTGHMLAL
jgi:hypothetical protein